MFHRFQASGGATRWQGAITAGDFEQILLYVGIERILSPEEWIARLDEGRLAAGDLCLTFDDGLKCQMEHALPVLERHGLRAFWFVSSCVAHGRPIKGEVYSYVAGRSGGMESLIEEFLDRCSADMRGQLTGEAFRVYAAQMSVVAPFYSPADVQYRFLRNQPRNTEAFEGVMDDIVRRRGFDPAGLGRCLWLADEDLETLADRGHVVGLHSYDHPYDMASLSRAEQWDQYERNFRHVAEATGRRPISASHPLNSYSDDSLAILSELGIRCGFRANMEPPAGRSRNPDRLELAREDSANLVSMMTRSDVTYEQRDR